ncbi:DnaJ domain-containing protein [Paracrocinitomix mangrovi]|uniref:DnaJ domain-containing protein n=1 Tax=Paracrocinitomix mangrovi TaxID=2862509 RepID=UPI001C8F02BA|nr:DnaJ domain-containing protein [Paracrocinitomix mangrovi]UKN03741.1 DnaJ domain-containing protein [Paracrocinitomix mangrovi]
MNYKPAFYLRWLLFFAIAAVVWVVMDLEPKDITDFDSNFLVYLVMCSFYLFLITADMKELKKLKIVKEKYNVRDEEDFNSLLLGMVAYLLGFNANSKDTEFKYLEKTFLKYFSQQKTDYLMARLIKDHLTNQTNLNSLLENCKTKLNEAELNHLLFILVGVATVDKLVDDREKSILSEFVSKVGLSFSDLNSAYSQFTFEFEEDKRKEQNREKEYFDSFEEWYKAYQGRRQGYSAPSTSSIEKAYETLELPYNSPLEDVKKQYRKLAKKHHPDLIAHLGKEHVKIAEEKFKGISNAYELLQKHLGKV